MAERLELETELLDLDPELDSDSTFRLSAHELEGEVRLPLLPPSARIVPCAPAAPQCRGSQEPSGAGRRRTRTRRRTSREHTRWVQRALNRALGLRLSVDGILGPRTRSAIRQFQRREKLTVDGVVGRATEARLAQRSGIQAPGPSLEAEAAAGAAAVSAGAAVVGAGIQLVKFGFEAIRTVTHGEIRFTGPSSPVGIRAVSLPPNLVLKARTCQTIVVDFEDVSPVGIEQVNVKLRCLVQYDGVRLEARFLFDPDGKRSRLMRDTLIRVHDALTLEKQPAPRAWRECGVTEYGVLRIPMEFRVDRPWPLSNYNENFTLVLSAMHGFGASASDRQHIKDQRVAWN